MKRRSNPFVYSIVLLGAIGIVYTLFTQPGRLLTQIGMMALFAGIIFLVYKLYMKKRVGGSAHTAYMRAAKQSKRRYNEPVQSSKASITKVIDAKKISSTSRKPSSPSTGQKKKKTATHLTVIEGKKGKKKNRAFF